MHVLFINFSSFYIKLLLLLMYSINIFLLGYTWGLNSPQGIQNCLRSRNHKTIWIWFSYQCGVAQRRGSVNRINNFRRKKSCRTLINLVIFFVIRRQFSYHFLQLFFRLHFLVHKNRIQGIESTVLKIISVLNSRLASRTVESKLRLSSK